MTEFLKKLGLIDHFQTVLKVDKMDFVKALTVNIDKPESIFDFSNIFSRSKNAYNGVIQFDSFELKRNRKFNVKNYSTIAKGKFTQRGDDLVIDIEVNGFPQQMIAYYVMLLLFYAVLFFGLFISDDSIDIPGVVLLFFSVHAAVMFGTPIFMIRRGVRAVRYELERDLFYMIRHKRHNPQDQP